MFRMLAGLFWFWRTVSNKMNFKQFKTLQFLTCTYGLWQIWILSVIWILNSEQCTQIQLGGWALQSNLFASQSKIIWTVIMIYLSFPWFYIRGSPKWHKIISNNIILDIILNFSSLLQKIDWTEPINWES